MGEELVIEPVQNPRNTELFYEALPQYLAIGMTSEEFWHGDPQLVVAYQKANKIKRSNKNFEAWLHNKYTTDAIQSALYGEKAPYPEEPYPLSQEEIMEQRRRKLKKRKAYLQAQAEANKKEAPKNGSHD